MHYIWQIPLKNELAYLFLFYIYVWMKLFNVHPRTDITITESYQFLLT